jgi:ferredoxin-NADP reductase
VEGAAVLVSWSPGTLVEARQETARARTLRIEVEGWTRHVAGQHVDIRLTAEDGYTAVRSYSIASSASSGLLEITVDRLDDGEVSPYLVDGAEVGDRFEVRGPAGGWFVWRPDPARPDSEQPDSERPVQLIGGGSGVVPLMAMIRSHADTRSAAPFRLLYSVREPGSALFHDELVRREAEDETLDVTWNYSRTAPAGWAGVPGRLTPAAIADASFPPGERPAVFVCGSTPFVEQVADALVAAGHHPADVRTERYGG